VKAISFGWTTLPLLAGEKSVTRRSWKDTYAARWWDGTEFFMLDKDYRYGGKRLGIGKLTANPVKELACEAPSSDFAAEGFAWYVRHPEHLSPAFRRQLGGHGLRGFLSQHALFWVVRFEPVEWFVSPSEELAQRMSA